MKSVVISRFLMLGNRIEISLTEQASPELPLSMTEAPSRSLNSERHYCFL